MSYACPHCDAPMSADAVMGGICPECRKVVELSATKETSAPLPESAATQQEPVTESATGERLNFKRGVVVGIISGIMVFFFYIILDALFFRAKPFAGWLETAVGIVILGSVMGAVIGLVVEKTRSKAFGILAGAVVLAVIYMFILTGAGMGFHPGFAIAGLFSGAFHGAIIGWAISSSVMEHIRREA